MGATRRRRPNQGIYWLMTTEDRRRVPRVTVNDEFALLGGDLSKYATNLSSGGLFFRCEPNVPVGTELDLKFSILLDDIEEIRGRGVVIHLGTPGDPGLGIKFTALSKKSLDLLTALED